MTENITDMDHARRIAEEHSKPGKFSFVDRLNSRNYPTEDVTIYLDERAGHIIERLTEDLLNATDPEQAKLIEKQIAHHSEQARSSRYIVHMQGISTEAYDAIVDAAQAEYPLEYRESRNPITMKLEREVVENEDRETFFRTHLWALFIQSIEDADGNIDDDITPEAVGHLLGRAPIAAQARIGVGVNSLRMVTNWMDDIQGEDFLAKS